jgi:hypothetical protein
MMDEGFGPDNVGDDASNFARDVERGSRRRSQWFPLRTDGRTEEPDDEAENDPGPQTARGHVSRGLVIGAAAFVVVLALASANVSWGGGTSEASEAAEAKDVPTSAVPQASGIAQEAHAQLVPVTGVNGHTQKPPTKRTKPAVHERSVSGATAAPPHSTASTPTRPDPVGSWPLDSSGTAFTADATGAHTSSASHVTYVPSHGGAGAFDGKDSAITTSGPVLNTAAGSSFTVSAWVYLSDTDGFATAVSQDGAVNSGFYLQYNSNYKRWAFVRSLHDDSKPTAVRALSSAPPKLKTWTHLVGVFDASDEQLRLYVNGVQEGTASDSTPFAADGNFAIGRAQYLGGPVDWFRGDIQHVEVFTEALSSSQVKALD